MHDEQFQPDPVAVAILRASMLHVPFDGWGEAALIAGAADSGHDAAAVHSAFPRGAIDAIALHSRLADQSMVDAFLALPERPEKVHLTIRALVLLRLEIAQPDKDAVRRALSLLAMPANAKLSAKLLYETVDSCGAPQASAIPAFPFIQSAGHLPRFTARRCWHGLLIIVAILMEPLIFLIGGLPILPAFPKSPNRCVPSFRLVSGLPTV